MAVIFALFAMNPNPPSNDPVAFRSNPELLTIHPDSSFKGVAVNGANRFINRFQPFQSNMRDMLKWQLSQNPFKELKKADHTRLNVIFNEDILKNDSDRIVWLGHASFFIQINGKRILIDPVLSELPLMERFSELPVHTNQLSSINYLLISHDHRDHCDKKSIQLLTKQSPQMEILTGLNMTSLLEKWAPNSIIQEAGWYQRYNLNDSLEIIYVPSRHWSRRGLLDENKRLWGGFVIKTPDITIYFMGDSGYGPHFKEIATTCGSPDYAIMGVGAFEPQWFMHPVHISPTDAVKAFDEMGGKVFIPMHYGTFDLSDEPLLHPLDLLEKMERSDFFLKPPGSIITID